MSAKISKGAERRRPKPSSSAQGSAASSNYTVRERGDGVWCIYLRKYNVVVAEFSKGCASAAQEIKAMLDGELPPNDSSSGAAK